MAWVTMGFGWDCRRGRGASETCEGVKNRGLPGAPASISNIGVAFLMKAMRIFVIVVLALSAAGGGSTVLWKLYGMFYNVILEAKDVEHLRVEEGPETHPMRLKISGHPFYSGMVVREISATEKGPIITVLVHLAAIGLVKPKTSGVFEYDLSVPDSVDEVRFGRNATVIWNRRAFLQHGNASGADTRGENRPFL